MIVRERLLALLIVGCLVVGFGGGVAADRFVFFGGAAPTEPADAQPVFGVFWQAWRLVEEHYVDASAATPEKLTQGAITGMLSALGDTGHTRYLTPTDRKQEANDLAGRLEGIGIEVEERDQGITVVAPLDNSPAQKAGLQPGDVIVKVDGKDVANMTMDEVSHLIRGQAGTSVKLTILRPGAAELLNFTITRQEVSVPDVTWATIPGQKIAHIRISSFGENTDQQLRQAVQELESGRRHRDRPGPAKRSRRPARPVDQSRQRVPDIRQRPVRAGSFWPADAAGGSAGGRRSE